MTIKSYTAAIIGGGPAGSQCALWLKMMGMHPVIIESSDHLGGLQSLSPYQNQWIAGLMGVSGREFAERIQSHLRSKDIPVLFNAELESCKQTNDGFSLVAGGTSLQAKYIVIATGAEQKRENNQASRATDQAEHDISFASQTITAAAGWQANLPKALNAFRDQLIGNNGFIATNINCETPVAGIFAIGEAANRMHPCVITSMADGVVAAKAIQELVE